MPDRKEVLMDLLERRRATSAVWEDLKDFGWDSDELVVLERRHLEGVLNAFISGEISASDVEEWANVVEVRDDIGFPPGDDALVRDAIFELANPILTEPLTLERARGLEKKLRPGEGQ